MCKDNSRPTLNK